MMHLEIEDLYNELSAMQDNETDRGAHDARDYVIQRLERIINMEKLRPISPAGERMKSNSLTRASELWENGFHLTPEEIDAINKYNHIDAVKSVLNRFKESGRKGGFVEAKSLVDAYRYYGATDNN